MTTTLEDLAPLAQRQWDRFGRETPIEGLLLGYAEAPSPLMRPIYRPSFCAVLQGAKYSMLGAHRFRYAAGQGLLAALELPTEARITEASPARPYLSFSLAIDPAMVAELLPLAGEATAGAATAGEATTEGAMTREDAARAEPAEAPVSILQTADIAPDLHDPIRRLLELLDRPGDTPVLAPLIRREIVWRLLGGALGPALRQIGLRDSRAARIGRTTAWIHAHYAEPIRVPDLAALAGMSVPSFHRHFKAVTMLTPVRFQKKVRLREARQLLLAHHEVASVSYAVGYESPSQFSRDYRREFGAPPGRDGAALRASLTPEAAI